MPETGLITPQMRAAIGNKSAAVTYEVSRTSIRMFARAVGYRDPIYYDIDAARAAGYADLPCPPGYLGTPVFHPGSGDQEFQAMLELEPARPLTRQLNGGTEFEYFGDIIAGDVLSATSSISDIAERSASLGPMLIVTTRTEFTNARGGLVAVMTGTGIRY